MPHPGPAPSASVFALAIVVMGVTPACRHANAPAVTTTPSIDARDAPPFDDDSTYGALLQAIESSTQAGRDGCLLEPSGFGLRFVGEAAPAIAPLPAPDLRGRDAVRDATQVRVLSRWGIDGDSGPAVATVTHVPPADELGYRVLVIADGSAWLRSTRPSALRLDAARDDTLRERLRAEADRTPVLLVASADEPLGTLRRYLRALDAADVPVGLALALHPDAAVPRARAEPATSQAGRCESLPPLPEGEAIGALEADAVRDVASQLRVELASCTESNRTRRVARGGRLRVAVRIAGDGSTSQACATLDTVDDEGFRTCVLERVRAARWPVPAPQGAVDVLVPWVLPADATSVQRGLCPNHDVR